MITLATLPEATAQEVFDQVKTHMLTQMKKAEVKPGSNQCLYRSPDGLKCAAGILIADNEYKPEMDDVEGDAGGGWATLVRNRIVPSVHSSLIENLQSIHDCSEVDEWEAELLDYAKRNNLTF